MKSLDIIVVVVVAYKMHILFYKNYLSGIIKKRMME